jgi:hypothetical protein
MNFPDRIAAAISAFPNSFRAWVKAGLISWPILSVLLIFFMLVYSGGRLEPVNVLAVLAMSTLFYIGGYVLIGVPFFTAFWPSDDNRIWNMKFGVPLGVFFGYLGMWLVLSLLDSRPVNLFDADLAAGCLYGAVYGLVTATVACKIKNANKAQMATPRRPSD